MKPAQHHHAAVLALTCALLAGPAAAAEIPCIHPPSGEMDLEGPHIRVGSAVWAGPAARVIVKWVDEKTGGPITQVLSQTREELAAFAARPGTVAELKFCDGAGAGVRPLTFAVDATPPELAWEVVDLDEFPNRRRGARNPDGLSWSGGARWLPLKTDGTPVRIGSDTPQLLLHGARFDIQGTSVRPNGDQMLRVRFKDNGAGVAHLTFRVGEGQGGKTVLHIEMEDLVGNARKIEWGLSKASDAPSSTSNKN